jgi:hypothetical protein
VDHATRLIHNTHQLSTTTAETVLSKHVFEDLTLSACAFRNMSLIIIHFMVEIGLMTARINVSLTSSQALVLIIKIMQKAIICRIMTERL